MPNETMGEPLPGFPKRHRLAPSMILLRESIKRAEATVAQYEGRGPAWARVVKLNRAYARQYRVGYSALHALIQSSEAATRRAPEAVTPV